MNTSRMLIVGDPHVTAEELGDSTKLLGYVESVVTAERPDAVLFLGDLYHTHSMMHVEVMAFWHYWLARLSVRTRVLVLVGNHDMPGNDASRAHALLAHADARNVTVIDTPMSIDGVDFVPYCANNEDFIQAAQLGGKTLVCHQTFDGSRFDNGIYAPDGADSNLLHQETVISGHIHTPQAFGKVWYPGAPRWRILSDANVDRAIWMVTFLDGRVIEKVPFSMKGVCREIRQIEVTPGSEVPHLEDGVEWRIDIKGPEAFVSEMKQKLGGAGRKLRPQVVGGARQVKVRESQGVGPAFRGYVQGFQPKHGTPIDTLEKLAMKRLGWS